jgi:hypothetical protein
VSESFRVHCRTCRQNAEDGPHDTRRPQAEAFVRVAPLLRRLILAADDTKVLQLSIVSECNHLDTNFFAEHGDHELVVLSEYVNDDGIAWHKVPGS